MKLALAMGRLDVDGVAAELSADQLNEWMAYDSIDPFGGERGDVHAASIQHNAYWLHTGGKGRMKPSEFLPRFTPRVQVSPAEKQKRLWVGLADMAKRFNRGKDARASSTS